MALVGLLLLAALALSLTLGVASASAVTYSPATPPSICVGTGVNGGECGELRTVAVDSSNGQIYVADNGNARVNQFAPDGTFVRAFGADVVASGQHETGTGAEVCEPVNSTPVDVCKKGIATASVAGAFGNPIRGIAVDPTTHVVYVATAVARLAYFDGSTGAFLGQTEGASSNAPSTNVGAPEKFALLAGLAIDTTTAGGPYLYVAINPGTNPNFKSKIDKFTTSASGLTATSYVCQITGTAVASSINNTECGGNGDPAHKDGAFEGLLFGGSAIGAAQRGGNIAVDSIGNVYIAESPALLSATPAGRHVVSKFDKEGDFVSQFKPSGGTPPLSATEPRPEALAVTSDDNLLVASGAAVGEIGGPRVQEYDPDSPGSPLTEFQVGTLAEGTGDVTATSNTISNVATTSGTFVAGQLITGAGIQANTTISNVVGNTITLSTTTEASATGNIALSASGATLGLAAIGDKVYVADRFNKKIFKYSSAPAGETLAIVEGGTGSGVVQCEINGGPAGACASSYPSGTSVKVTATANPGSDLASISGTGSASACAASPCTFVLAAPSQVTVTFDLEAGQKSLDVTIAGNGQVKCNGGVCQGSYASGTTVTLEAVPGANQSFSGWSAFTGSGTVTNPCTGTATTCEVKMDADVTGTATFVPINHTLTVSKTGNGTVTGTGIDCGVDCTESYLQGTAVTLTATPAANHSFTGWTGDCTGTTTCNVTMSAAKSVTATFAPINHTLTVSKTGNGTVTGTGIDCGVDCTESYLQGTAVTLTATPAANHSFTGWSGACTGASTTCNVTMSAAKSVTATFAPINHTLTVNKGGTGSGSVTCNGSACASAYIQGSTVTLTAAAASGSTFTGWSGAGCSGTGSCVITINAATAVTAAFTADPPSGGGGDGGGGSTPPPSNVITLGAAKPQGQAIALEVTVPGPGALVATGKKMVKASGTAKAAGAMSLKLKLTSAGKKQLKKKGKLKVKVKIVFTPTGGSPGTTTKTVTFKKKK